MKSYSIYLNGRIYMIESVNRKAEFNIESNACSLPFVSCHKSVVVRFSFHIFIALRAILGPSIYIGSAIQWLQNFQFN